MTSFKWALFGLTLHATLAFAEPVSVKQMTVVAVICSESTLGLEGSPAYCLNTALKAIKNDPDVSPKDLIPALCKNAANYDSQYIRYSDCIEGAVYQLNNKQVDMELRKKLIQWKEECSNESDKSALKSCVGNKFSSDKRYEVLSKGDGIGSCQKESAMLRSKLQQIDTAVANSRTDSNNQRNKLVKEITAITQDLFPTASSAAPAN